MLSPKQNMHVELHAQLVSAQLQIVQFKQLSVCGIMGASLPLPICRAVTYPRARTDILASQLRLHNNVARIATSSLFSPYFGGRVHVIMTVRVLAGDALKLMLELRVRTICCWGTVQLRVNSSLTSSAVEQLTSE